MKRRTFVKGLLGTGMATGGSLLFRVPLMSMAQAQIAAPPTLVVIFQRGGCDGLNAVVPFADPDCRVGGGAPQGWPPSAAQTARTVFP